jgi:dTDP-4-dehydrorhamnose reductase
MKYLLLGAGGQLGTAFRSLFGDLGQDCLAFDQELDITDVQRLSQVFDEARPDVVINCAAYNDVDRAEAEWRQAFVVNGIAVGGLARVAREHDCILVHYSTDYVFDGEKKAPYAIADHPCPISLYGESKLLGEEQLWLNGMRFFMIRTSWVFGQGGENFVTRVLRWAKGQQELKVVTDQVSAPTYSRDLAQATLKLLEIGRFGRYHLCNSGSCSRYDWAEFILKQINWSGRLLPAKSADFGTPASRPQYSVLDSLAYTQLVGEELPGWQEATLDFLKESGVI